MIQHTTQPSTTAAARCAAENFAANLRALRALQPDLPGKVGSHEAPLEWVFGRDGSLTVRTRDGAWWSGCSLPYRAALEMLKRLELRGAVACFLAPTHAAQVRAALEHLRPEQAIVVVLPEIDEMRVMLACENLAQHVESHRLWFAIGADWETQLENLYGRNAGLAPPAQFIRVPVTSSHLIDRLIPRAQEVLSRVAQRRSSLMHTMRQLPWARPSMNRLLVVAPSRFRLWNDLGHALSSAARDAASESGWACTPFDADDPVCSSPLGLAVVARQCSAILTANTARCDLSGVLPDELPWITWVTGTRIPSFTTAGPCDHLILADENLRATAGTAGWPEARVHIGTWPPLTPSPQPSPCVQGEGVVIVCDTSPLDAPEELNEYSSHTILWETIREELLRDPLATGTDVNAYLARHMRRLEIADDGFPRQLFVARLIIPAYQQSIARMLIGAKLALRFHGGGWGEIPAFASRAAGPIESREHLAQVLAQSRAVVHAWPSAAAHPIDTCGVPVLDTFGRSRSQITGDARRLLDGSFRDNGSHNKPLCGDLLREILAKIAA